MDLNTLKTLMDEFRASGYGECRLEADGVILELRRTAGMVRNAGTVMNGPGAGTAVSGPGAGSGFAANPEGQSSAEGTAADLGNTPLDSTISGKAENISLVKASMAGTFYTSAKPGDAPYVSEGTRVSRGDTLGLLEAMKVISEITSPVSGTVETVLMEDAAFAEYDAPLFRIREDV